MLRALAIVTGLLWAVLPLTAQCAWDPNGNGTQDEADLIAWCPTWNHGEGHPGYEPGADLSGNGRTDVGDAVLLVAALGQACGPSLAGCPVFPTNNIWNTPVDNLPVHANSAAYIATMGANTGLHPDFGSGLWQGAPIGIPFMLVPGDQPLVPIAFEFDDESDPGPYPIPPDPLIEGGPESDGDRHILLLDTDNCLLYEVYYAWPRMDGGWDAGSGAIFDLSSNALRPDGWTSADAAGLPILPGLVRYDEVDAGEIKHALRFTATPTQRAYLWPARHFASNSTNPDHPPMGLRLRLKASVDLSGFSEHARVILQGLKKYGMILADNGSNWYISGAPDDRWDNDVLHEIDDIQGSDFEVVDVSSLIVDPDSGATQEP